MLATQLIVDDGSFAVVIDQLSHTDRYAVDTEFHRERTYYPKVALVQIAWDDHIALVDPLKVSLLPLARVLDGPGLAIMHAATQDLEVLQRATGTVPSVLFDTQVAAGFVGMRSPSLAAVVDKMLGISLPKGDRLTDWLERPLRTTQLEYAASDVEHLIAVEGKLTADLARRGRLEWAEAEAEELRLKSRIVRDPAEAWLRIKEARHLSRRGRGVAKAIAEWREHRAMAVDIPPRFVLPDLAVIGIAQRPPNSLDELRRVRGLDDRHARGDVGEELLRVISVGLDNEIDLPRSEHGRGLKEELRPAVALVSSWLSQYSADLDLDPALLGTRADIEALLGGVKDARLATGWRHALAGEPVQRLVSGRAALAFERGRLVLEDRIDHR